MKELHKYPFDLESTTVKTSKQWLASVVQEGAVCPCCEQVARTYRRKIYAALASALLLLYRVAKEEKATNWQHLPTLFNGRGVVARGGDFTKLTYWELIQGHPSKVGYYRLTEKGIQFAACRIAVPEAVYLYSGEILSWDTKMVTIVDVVGGAKRYEELTGGRG